MKSKRLTMLDHVFAALRCLKFSVVIKSGIITLTTSEKTTWPHIHTKTPKHDSFKAHGLHMIAPTMWYCKWTPKWLGWFAPLTLKGWALINGHRFLSRSSVWNGQTKGLKHKHKSCWWNFTSCVFFCLSHLSALQVCTRSRKKTQTCCLYKEHTHTYI